MKQKLFAFSLMALLCAGVWAQQRMTVRVVDDYDTPVPYWTVQVTDFVSPENEDGGFFTTDSQGEFTIERKNTNPLRLSAFYGCLLDIQWDGSAEPVVFKQKDMALFTLHWPGQTPEQYAAACELRLKNENIETFGILAWDADGVGRALCNVWGGSSSLWHWRLSGHILGMEYQSFAGSISDVANRNLQVEFDWSNLCRLDVDVQPAGKEYAAYSFSLLDAGSGTLVDYFSFRQNDSESNPAIDEGMFFIPAGNYRVEMTGIAENISADVPDGFIYKLPAPDRVVSIKSGQLNELHYDYGKGVYHCIISVLGMDGTFVPDAGLLIPNCSAKLDKTGQAVLVGFPGEYTCAVNWLLGGMDYLEMRDTIRITDKDQIKNLSFADYYRTVAVKIESADFVSDPSMLDLDFEVVTKEHGWESSTSKYPKYDEATGLYTVLVPKLEGDGMYYRYAVGYPGMFPKKSTVEDIMMQTITIDLGDYHAAKFIPANAETQTLSDIWVRKVGDSDYGCNADKSNTCYLEAGEYTVAATVTNPITGDVYPSSGEEPQTFTMGDKDMELKYQFDESAYCHLTVSLIGADGNGIPNEHVILASYYGNVVFDGFTDENGQAVVPLRKGEYSIDIFGSGGPYPRYYETGIEVEGDQEMTVSYEGYKLVTATLSGDVAQEFAESGYGSSFEVYLREAQTEAFLHKGTLPDVFSGSFRLVSQGNTLTSECGLYVPEGIYYYQLKLSADDRYLRTEFGNRFELTEDKDLQIDLSSDQYSKVTVNAVDENGQKMDGQVTVRRAEKYNPGETISSYTYPLVVFLPDGDYKAYYRDDSYTVSENFTVDGRPQEVTLTGNRQVNSYTLNVKVKLPAEMVEHMDKDFMKADLLFLRDGLSVDYAYVDIDPITGEGTYTTQLLAGTYTYELHRGGQPKIGTFTLSADGQELSINMAADPYLLLRVTDEQGNPINDASVEIFQDGKYIDYTYSEANITYGDICSFLPAGRFDVLVYENGYQSVKKSVVMGTTSQTVDVVLPLADPDNFEVMFEIRDELYNYVRRPGIVTLDAIGSRATGFSYTTFVDVPAATYSYTIEVDGFEPYKGLVVVNEASAYWPNKNVHMVVYLKEKASLMSSIGAPMLENGDGTFRLFPTVANDVLHVVPSTASGECMLRLHTAQGVQMYAARHNLDGETVLPVGTLPAGLYLLTIEQCQETYTYKFMKK